MIDTQGKKTQNGKDHQYKRMKSEAIVADGSQVYEDLQNAQLEAYQEAKTNPQEDSSSASEEPMT